MPADAWKFYNTFHLWLGDGTFDMDADQFKMALYLSTSNAAGLTNQVLSGLTNEHPNVNGYVTGGKVMSGVVWTLTGGVAKFSADDTVWLAAGGSIAARYAVIYKNGTANGRVNPLVAFSLLNNAPADVIATDSNSLTIRPHASGIMTLSG